MERPSGLSASMRDESAEPVAQPDRETWGQLSGFLKINIVFAGLFPLR